MTSGDLGITQGNLPQLATFGAVAPRSPSSNHDDDVIFIFIYVSNYIGMLA
jgi:hypothetical protein